VEGVKIWKLKALKNISQNSFAKCKINTYLCTPVLRQRFIIWS